MTDREKVIKGMECCMITPGPCGTNCPYADTGDENDYCDQKIIKDAFALLKAQEQKCRECGEATSKAIQELQAKLKAQEPRLVTYDDFHSGREDGGEAIPCWKEARSKTRRSGWAVIVYGKMLADRETGVARYWTARPTEEQMREAAWPGA